MKTILVTGAGPGIGRATALLAGQRGWSVAVSYVADTIAAEATVAGIVEAGGKAMDVSGGR